MISRNLRIESLVVADNLPLLNTDSESLLTRPLGAVSSPYQNRLNTSLQCDQEVYNDKYKTSKRTHTQK